MPKCLPPIAISPADIRRSFDRIVSCDWRYQGRIGNGLGVRAIRSTHGGGDRRCGVVATARTDVAVLGPADGFRGCNPCPSSEPGVAINDFDGGSSGFRNVSAGRKATIPSAAYRPTLVISMPSWV